MSDSQRDPKTKKPPSKPAETPPRHDDVVEHDQDSEPPRTARPPGDEPEWGRDDGC